MKKIIAIGLTICVLWLLGACSSDTLADDALSLQGTEDRAQVDIDLLLPLADLPSPRSRAITDDSSIQVDPQTKLAHYTVLVFNKDLFVETVRPGDTYTDANGQVQPKIVYNLTQGGRMKIALDKTMDQVRLMMVANHQLSAGTLQQLTKTTTWDRAVQLLQKEPFTYTGKGTGEHMPMYGHTGTGYFQVKQGMVGLIQLQRCMARVILDCRDAIDHFKLETIFLYNINQTGYIAPSLTIQTPPLRDAGPDQSQPGNNPARFIQGTVDAVNNVGIVYVPELTNMFLNADAHSKNTSIIFKGIYTLPKANATDPTQTEERFYRLEFIRRDLSSGSIQYKHIQELRRNTSYVFQIDYLVNKNAVTAKDNIFNQPAANHITEGVLQTFEFTDAGIKDITTDNLTYLGVTDSKLLAQTTADEQYYCVNVRVITNHPEGFAVQTLPKGCTTSFVNSPDQWNSATRPTDPKAPPQVFSIWFFFNRDVYDPPTDQPADPTKSETLYFYAGNIRKSVTVYSPYSIGSLEIPGGL